MFLDNASDISRLGMALKLRLSGAWLFSFPDQNLLHVASQGTK